MNLFSKALMAFLAIFAAYISNAITNSLYINSLTSGFVTPPSLMSSFVIPYAITVSSGSAAIVIATTVYTGGSELEGRIVTSAIGMMVAIVAMASYIGSDKYFMYQEDGYRGNDMMYKMASIVGLTLAAQV